MRSPGLQPWQKRFLHAKKKLQLLKYNCVTVFVIRDTLARQTCDVTSTFTSCMLNYLNNRFHCSPNNSLLSFSAPDWLLPKPPCYTTNNQNILWKSHVVSTKGKINMPHWTERSQYLEHKSNNHKQANTNLTGQNIPKIMIINRKHSERITSRQQRYGTCLTDQNIVNINNNNRQTHALLARTFWPQPTTGHGTETITNRSQLANNTP